MTLKLPCYLVHIYDGALSLLGLNTCKGAPYLFHDARFGHINGLTSPKEKGSTGWAQREPAA